jgi:Xaa-Pro aminopeptidase
MIRKAGLSPSFEPIVSSGRNTWKVHYTPGSSRIGRGPVIVDMGVVYRNYCSDLTRTFMIDPIPIQEKMLALSRDIQSDLISMCVPGTAFSDIQNAYEKALKSNGFKVLQSFGHGIGLSVHERPGRDDVLEKNMVLAVEPGIYKKGIGGVRIEDMVLVGKKPRVLS